MGDPLKKVQPGQRLRVPAQTFNTFIDVARDYLGRRQGQGGGPLAERPQQGVVRVKNSSGADRGRFEVLGIDAPLFGPGDNEREFANGAALVGVTPTADHVGLFVILLEPLKDGCIGRGLVQGLTPVHIRVDEGCEDLGFADVCTDEGEECPYLVLAAQGAAQVLYLAPAADPPADPDVRWALVRVSNASLGPAVRNWSARVTGVYNSDGDPWTSYALHGWQAFVSAHPLYENGTPDETTVLWLKLSADCGGAEVGYRDVAVGDDVGYVIAPPIEVIPGSDPPANYDGWVYPHGEADGATLSALQHADGGPGIVVDEASDPFSPKVSVDLAAVPGLEFDAVGDAGKLRVLPDGTHGIALDAAGVQVKIDLGLQFSSGSVKAKPDTARGLDVDASGLFVDLVAEHGLEFSAGDLQVKANGAKGVGVDADGLKVKTADADGLAFDGTTGDLKVKPSATKPSVELLADGVAVKINEADGGLEHNEAGLQVKIKVDGGINVDADGILHDAPGVVYWTETAGYFIKGIKTDALGHLKSVYVQDAQGEPHWHDLP